MPHSRVRTSGPHRSGSPASSSRVCIWVPPQLREHAPHCVHDPKLQPVRVVPHTTPELHTRRSAKLVELHAVEVAARDGGSEYRTRVWDPLPHLASHGDHVLLREGVGAPHDGEGEVTRGGQWPKRAKGATKTLRGTPTPPAARLHGCGPLPPTQTRARAHMRAHTHARTHHSDTGHRFSAVGAGQDAVVLGQLRYWYT